MPLQFDVHIFAAERAAELFHALDRRFDPALRQRVRERAFCAARQADEAAAHLRDFFGLNASLSFFCA